MYVCWIHRLPSYYRQQIVVGLYVADASNRSDASNASNCM